MPSSRLAQVCTPPTVPKGWLTDLDAISAGVLGFVQRRVSAREHLLGRVCGVHDGDAKRCGDGTCGGEWLCGQRLAYALSQTIIAVGAGQDYKLFAAPASKLIAATDLCRSTAYYIA